MKYDDIKIMPLRDQQKFRNDWQENRLKNLLPALMEEQGFDMWIVACEEDNQDPVLPTLLPQGLSADENVVMPPVGNQILLVFYRTPQGEMERLLISALKLRDWYENVWDESKETQWGCLFRIVKERQPSRIGINYSETFAHADGLSFTQHKKLITLLKPFADQIESAEKLAVSWLETRLPQELDFYPHIAEIGHAIIAKAFSNEVIVPGTTTTEDVGWWMRQCIRHLGLTSWFKPMVGVNRMGQEHMNFRSLIQRGDLLFCDMGLNYMGLLTDTQRQAYVLQDGEKTVPQGLKNAMQTCNRLQDIFFQEFSVGKSGNEVLASIHEKAQKHRIDPLLSAHPIGVFGHGPGAPVGVWNQQNGVPGRGDSVIRDHTCYAMELCVTIPIPEWNDQTIAFNLEQTVAMQNKRLYCLDQRQTAFYTIS